MSDIGHNSLREAIVALLTDLVTNLRKDDAEIEREVEGALNLLRTSALFGTRCTVKFSLRAQSRLQLGGSSCDERDIDYVQKQFSIFKDEQKKLILPRGVRYKVRDFLLNTYSTEQFDEEFNAAVRQVKESLKCTL